jgi:LysM repeat protein
MNEFSLTRNCRLLIAASSLAAMVLAGASASASTRGADDHEAVSGAVQTVASSVVEANRFQLLQLAGRIRYTVAPGDTLFGISQEYNVDVDDIRRWNNLDGDGLRPGQELVLYVRGRSSRVKIEREVQSGETGLGIALEYNIRLDALRRWNPQADLDRLRPGQKLNIYVRGSSSGGRDLPQIETTDPTAVGQPSDGRLLNGIVLDSGPGIDVRYRANAYGMPVTVDAIRYAYARLLAVFPNAPRVEVGDLSRETGGTFSPHRSHQNGLDADIAYFEQGEEEFCEFEALQADQLNVPLQWYLFGLWLEWDAVEYIFVDYDLQEPLYRHAQALGYSSEQLSRWFQYPRGISSRRGVIRHEPGHDDHFHVRFVEGVRVTASR